MKRRTNIVVVRLDKYQRSVPSPTVKNPLKMSKIKAVNSGSFQNQCITQHPEWTFNERVVEQIRIFTRLLIAKCTARCWIEELLQFNSTASFFQLAFDFFGFCLVNTFFDGGWHAFDKFLRVHQALASDVLDFLDDIKFLFTETS